ncbi:sensor histidine kinase [Planktothrix sp. FACHB-1355]|uniref:histidine kinase n=1 Tax=Aerosakkonema funiforme FACHB-1375 TaxID=2949571 RepID=A0A926VKT3_9CYAN|nr:MULTISPECIES: ATP-binding protein [Oscillatoriales]MBD2185533.1 sensor histidine kinase [Aerosakkonema funiforme FACHB-1375]MBD3561040.1 sensor histidine kinase [Planktothrix sp. FACHB-1355]
MFQATRRRLAIWYTTVTAVLLLLFATGVYLYVRNTLIERVDDTLNHVVEVVVRSLAIEAVSPNDRINKYRVNVEASFRDNADTVEDDRIDLEWFSPTGELLWSTFDEPLNVPIRANRTVETVRLAKSQETRFLTPSPPPLLRQVTQRVQMGRQVLGYLRVSHPWFEVTKPSHQLILDLSLGISAMVICVGAIGWLLSGLAMEPVRESYQHLKQFTSDASHELRSPIAMIQTNVQVALADPDRSSEQHQQQLKVIERLTQRLGRLVDDLLFLAREDSGIVQPRFSACPLDALLMEVVEEQQLLAAEKGIKLALDLVTAQISFPDETEEDFFTFQADWDRLARLFTNLIGNALQYTPIGGKVDVELQRIIRRGNHPQLQVKVIDSGIGIPEDALPHLFDRFFRVDPARTRGKSTGSGLGLAIAAAIVENHHGHIRVESVVDRGTTVTVTLPQYRLETH